MCTVHMNMITWEWWINIRLLYFFNFIQNRPKNNHNNSGLIRSPYHIWKPSCKMVLLFDLQFFTRLYDFITQCKFEITISNQQCVSLLNLQFDIRRFVIFFSLVFYTCRRKKLEWACLTLELWFVLNVQKVYSIKKWNLNANIPNKFAKSLLPSFDNFQYFFNLVQRWIL